MKKRIEAADLRAMGASAAAIDFYNDTDPLHIVREGGRYIVSGAVDFTADTEAELLAELDGCAAAFAEEVEA